MKEYSIGLNDLLNNYTNTQLAVLYSKAKKMYYDKQYEDLNLNIKAVRYGIVEALKGVEVLQDITNLKEKSEKEVLQEAGFEVKEI